MALELIVFLPLLAAIVAGFGNRAIGNFAAKLITTGALFVSLALSWPIFLGFSAGDQRGDERQEHDQDDGVHISHASGRRRRPRSSRGGGRR